MLQLTKAKYEGDILLLPSELLSSACTKVYFKTASDLKIHGNLLKEDTVYKLSGSAVLLLFYDGIQITESQNDLG